MQNIIIRVAGRAGVGKSTVMALIGKDLLRAGFTENQITIQYTHEDDHSRPLDVRLDAISDPKVGTHITIEEFPLLSNFSKTDYIAEVHRGAAEIMADLETILVSECSGYCLDDEEDRVKVTEILAVWMASSISEGLRRSVWARGKAKEVEASE